MERGEGGNKGGGKGREQVEKEGEEGGRVCVYMCVGVVDLICWHEYVGGELCK